MKEYTFLSLCSVVLTFFIDRLSKVNLFRKKEFYFFIVVILGFKFLVNGYLTGASIVMYNPKYFLGLRLGSIPLEDFLFGFSMVSLAIISWEYAKRNSSV